MADIVSPELHARLQENATEPMAATNPRRAKAMATIDAAILHAQETGQETPVRETGISAPPDALTPGQALLLKEQRAQRKEQEAQKARLTKEQEDILKAQEKLLGEQEAKRLRAEQEQEAAKSQFVKGAEGAIKGAQGVVHGADVRIGALPTPGSIAFPLILLLFFFFILIRVNGYSRLGHLWRVITGAERVGTVDLTVTGPGPGSVDSGIPVPTDGPPEQTSGNGGQGTNVLANLLVFPQLPANGVFRLGEF